MSELVMMFWIHGLHGKTPKNPRIVVYVALSYHWIIAGLMTHVLLQSFNVPNSLSSRHLYARMMCHLKNSVVWQSTLPGWVQKLRGHHLCNYTRSLILFASTLFGMTVRATHQLSLQQKEDTIWDIKCLIYKLCKFRIWLWLIHIWWRGSNNLSKKE